MPLFFAVENSTTNRNFIIALFLSLTVFSALQCSWLIPTLEKYMKIGPTAVAPVSLLFWLTHNLHITLSFIFYAHLSKRSTRSWQKVGALLLWALALSLLEEFLPRVLPWNLGHAWLAAGWEAYHLSSIVGFQNLSLLTLLTNAAIFLIASPSLLKRPVHALKLATLLIGVIISAEMAGELLHNEKSRGDKKVLIGIIQPNNTLTPSTFKKHQEFQKRDQKRLIVQNHLALTQRLLATSKPDIIVWPELAIKFALDRDFEKNRYLTDFRDFLKNWKVPLIVGAFSRKSLQVKDKNSVFFFSPNSKKNFVIKHDKTKLFPMGEYLPSIPLLSSILQQSYTPPGNYKPGRSTKPINFQGIRFGTQISYEGFFPELVRKYEKQGAQILLSVSNDFWFVGKKPAFQAFLLNAATAIESGLPLVRANNTGLSGLINIAGEIEELSPQNEPYIKTLAVKYHSVPTKSFYAKNALLFRNLRIAFFIIIFLLFLFDKKLWNQKRLDT